MVSPSTVAARSTKEGLQRKVREVSYPRITLFYSRDNTTEVQREGRRTSAGDRILDVGGLRRRERRAVLSRTANSDGNTSSSEFFDSEFLIV